MSTGEKRLEKHHFTYPIASFIIVFFIAFSVLYVIKNEVRKIEFKELKKNEERIVKLEKDFLGKELNRVISDLNYLNSAYENQLMTQSNYSSISQNWSIFSSEQKVYDQIRYIDINGNEKIRINLNKNGGFIVPNNKLQNKKDRYYFYETIKLQEGDIYVSPLDLNIENGELEVPHKPMIRFSTPIHDENGQIKGIIVLNYLAENMLKNFAEIAQNSQGSIVLLNSKSYWLSNIDKNLEWSFMFEDRKDNTFEKHFKEEWSNITKWDGQILTKQGLFTHVSVNFQDNVVDAGLINNTHNIYSSDGNWYIVSSISKESKHKSVLSENFLEILWDILINNIVYFSVIFIFSVIIAVLIYIDRRSYSIVKFQSDFDGLTRVYNRRAGINKLNQLYSSDNRRNILFTLCFIDINGLKSVNDILGHKLGDELIVTVVKAIKSVIREQDFIIRFGGDEFLIVFNGINLTNAEEIWKRINDKYDEINTNENRPYLVSVSHGMVSYENNQSSQLDDLIRTADEKMYEEKRTIKETLNVIK